MLALALSGNGLNIVLLVFGTLLLGFSSFDFFRKKLPANPYILHAGRIGGAYIAAVTAFLVVNFSFLPPLLVWLAPTLVGSAAIALSIRKLVRKGA